MGLQRVRCNWRATPPCARSSVPPRSGPRPATEPYARRGSLVLGFFLGRPPALTRLGGASWRACPRPPARTFCSISVIEPPAFSIAARGRSRRMVDRQLEAAFNSPSPSTRTPSSSRRTKPADLAPPHRPACRHRAGQRPPPPAAGRADLVEIVAGPRPEAALRQAAMKRHLAALEAADGDAGARRLALAAATAGLADAGTDAAADPQRAPCANQGCP